MNIAIIGAGNVGGALARRWAAAGHRVILGVRDTGATRVQNLLGPNITAAPVRDAVAPADAVLIAAPPEATRSIVDAMGDVSGKVIIDAMNSIRTRAGEFASTAEALRTWTGNPDVVKCFNAAGYNIMANPDFAGEKADMFMAGTSVRGKEVARRLALDAGFGACHDFGGDDRVPLLEQMALIWINLAMFQGLGREIAFRLLRR
jgi:predicted dinucleotide-binding enzyme